MSRWRVCGVRLSVQGFCSSVVREEGGSCSTFDDGTALKWDSWALRLSPKYPSSVHLKSERRDSNSRPPAWEAEVSTLATTGDDTLKLITKGFQRISE